MASDAESSPDAHFDARVEDYLDDKIQSFADLDNLDELLANVELQRNQLQSQLDRACKELDDARRSADDRQGYLNAQIDDFRQLQESIDQRIQIAAADEAQNEAIARLKVPLDRLRAVKLTQKYITLLHDVDKLQSEARSHLPASPKDALKSYMRLKDMSLNLRAVPGSHEFHIVDHVESITEHLWLDMKNIMSVELKALLDKRGWPRVDPQSEMDSEWMVCFEKLLDLQMPEIEHAPQVMVLLPFETMARIFVAEFRFHFLSDKPTSNPQSMGSHCFPWFFALVDKWEDFFRDNLCHLLASKFQDTPVEHKLVFVDPVSAFITAMLPVMREKVDSVVQEGLRNPKFLTNFMPQLMNFDDNLRSRYNYDGGYSDDEWPGLTGEVLDTHFDAWFQIERSLALERFEAIIESQDARKIDYDYAGAGKMKPTYAAVRITDLLRSVTIKYQRLRKLRHKAKFLTNIQLDILDAYHDRLRGSLEAYQSLTSTIGRTLHGVTKEQAAALQGTGALETLCKVIGSVDHVALMLKEWSDEEFFAVMWDELQSKEAKRPSQEESLATLDTDFDSHESLSASLANNDGDAAIFDETASAYTNRRKAAEDFLVAALVDSHQKAFRAYVGNVQWTTVGESAVLDDPSALSVTPELDEPIRIIKRNFEFLIKALSVAALRRVWRQVLEKLQTALWSGVLMRQSFTTLGAAQFAHDCGVLSSLVESYLPSGSGALASLQEGLVLLALPAASPSAESANEDAEPRMTLKEASDRAFKDNDGARGLLEEMHLEALTPVDARGVLERRVENNEAMGW